MIVLAITFFLLSYGAGYDRHLFSGGAAGSVNITVINEDTQFIRNISDLTIAKDAQRRINLTAHFRDPEAQPLNFTLIPSPVPNVVFTINNNNGQTNITTSNSGTQAFVVINGTDAAVPALSNNFTIHLAASADENGEIFKLIDVPADTEWVLNMTSTNLIVDKILLKPDDFVTNITINVTHRINTTVIAQGDGVNTNTYTPFAYINFDTRGINTNLTSLQIDFRVSKYFITLNGLDKTTVKLLSYNGASYSEVTTIKYAAETNDDFFYSATPGNFTLFAVTADAVTGAGASPFPPIIAGGASAPVGGIPFLDYLQKLFPPAKEIPLGLGVEIQRGFKNILPGDIVKVDITIPKPVRNAIINYYLVDEQGNFRFLESEAITTSEPYKFVKTLDIPPDAELGDYLLSMEMIVDGQIFIGADSFVIVRAVPLVIPGLNAIVMLLLLAIFFAEVRYLLAKDTYKYFARVSGFSKN